MPSSHHYSLSHPASAARRHVKHPLTPPLTPSSSINSTRPAPADVPPKDDHTRIVLLTNLVPTLDPSLLEHTIHQILSAPARIKGINTRPLPATRSAPVVFFDSRDASAVCHAVASGTSLLDPVCADGPVGAEMISVAQLVKDIGPSPFLDSIDACFHLRVHATKQINLPILQSLLASFGQLRTFAPESAPEIDLDTENALYLIEYFDSRDGHRAIHDLDGKVLFAMSLSVQAVSPDAQVQFPSIAADVDTCEKPGPIGPPGSVSNLRIRFRSLGFEEPEPTLLYASSPSESPDESAPSDPICVYCPNEGSHYPPPPPPPPPHLLPPSYPPPDAGIVYYPSLSVPPAPTTGYEYLDAHYAPTPAPPWGGYDMVPLPMGMVPMPMPMPMPPPPHPYYEGAAGNGGGRGYVVPYGHPPPLYGHLQNQRFIAGEGGTPSSGSSVGSSSGSAGRVVYQGTPPPLMGARLRANLKGLAYKDREKGGLTERACSCSRSSPAPSTSLEDTNITPSTEPPATSSDLTTGGTATTPPTERNQLNIKRIEEGLDTRTTVMIKNIPNKMSDRDLMVFIERVCPRRIDFFYLRMDFQNGCNVGYAFVNFIHVQDLLRFAKARLGVKWNMFSSEKVLQMSYANYQGKEALVEKFKNSAIMDEREAWRPRIFYSSGQNQGFPEPFPPPTHMRRKERSFFNRGALFVPAGGVGADGRRGMRVGGGVLKDGTEALGSRNLSVGGLTFGKGWLGRGASDQETEVVGGV